MHKAYIFVLIFLGLALPIVAEAEVQLYACSDNDVVGFKQSNNMRDMKFAKQNFALQLDTDNKVLIIKKLAWFGTALPPRTSCGEDALSGSVYCERGDSFISFNPAQLTFTRGQGNANWKTMPGDLYLAFGECERL